MGPGEKRGVSARHPNKARATASQVPPNATLLVVPVWNGLSTWDWVDGAAMAYGFLELVSALVAVLGLALLASGVVIRLRKRSGLTRLKA